MKPLGPFDRDRNERDLADEIAFHLAEEARLRIDRGEPEASAYAAAQRDFGNRTLVQEITREMWGWTSVETLRQDLTYGLRQLRRSPMFAIVAVLTLALGIGANTAIFAVVDAVLLRPMPYRDANRLVLIEERIPKFSPNWMSLAAPDVLDFQRENRAFESVAGFIGTTIDLTGEGQPQRVQGLRATSELFATLGVAPLLGRGYTAAEDQPNSGVAVISYRLWQRQFGGDPHMAGRVIHLNREPTVVVGVMPKDFEFPLPGLNYGGRIDVWIPMAFTALEREAIGDNFSYAAVARMKPGVSLAQAAADAQRVSQRIVEKWPPSARQEFSLEGTVEPMTERVVAGSRDLLWLLAAAVGFVLLIACANVANLLLGRAARREKELAIRVSLGAGRVRLLRQLLTESLVLAAAGGVAGLGLGLGLLRWTSSLIPASVPRAGAITLDWRVAAFTVAVSLLAAIIFGTIPAFAASRSDEGSRLKDAARGATAGSRRARLRGWMVVSEVALSLTLLIGAGLLVRSFVALSKVDPGFDVEHLLTASVSLPSSTYPEAPQIRGFYRRLAEDLRAIPGARAAGAATMSFLTTTWTHTFTIRGVPDSTWPTHPVCSHSLVIGDYFQAAGIPLKRGRYIEARDRAGAEHVVVINETLASRFFHDQDPLGRQIRWGGDVPDNDSPWLTVVGVVADAKNDGVGAAARPQTYQSYLQVDKQTIQMLGAEMTIVVSARNDPNGLASAVRASVGRLDPQLPVTNLQTARTMIQGSLAPASFQTVLVGSFAALALLLAAIGIYGVVSYAVLQRTQEIGVRIALGATRSGVLGLVLRDGMAWVLMGVVLGLGGALALTRLLSNFLYGVTARDTITFVAAPVLLCAIALLANLVPAHRAASLDPAVALRHE